MREGRGERSCGDIKGRNVIGRIRRGGERVGKEEEEWEREEKGERRGKGKEGKDWENKVRGEGKRNYER